MAGIKSPAWMRALQIGIGATAVGLSIPAMIFPATTVIATFTAASIILLLFGIEQVVTGVFLYRESRFTHIGLGMLVVILASLVLGYPLATSTLMVFLAAVALLLSGIASVILGLRGRNRRNRQRPAGRGSRALSIGAGALAIALSIAIMASPTFGIRLAGVLIGIALLVYGIRLGVTGVAGRGHAVTSASSDTMAA
jgi:uncharacterized membrane protein HdeD (DUF308 family)